VSLAPLVRQPLFTNIFTMPAIAPWLLLGYLCGSIPVGVLIGRAKGVDVRQAGSGNVGATNVSRLLGRPWGIACFLLDVLKGLTPVLAAGLLGHWSQAPLTGAKAWSWLAVGAAAVLGHVFPVWLGFRGGKGAATGLGAVLGYWPAMTIAALAALVTWGVLVAIWRYVSLASIVAVAVLPLYVLIVGWLLGMPSATLTPFVVVTLLLALLVIVRHRANIARLRAGTESKIGQKHQPSAP
jgi:glycerol-3-phosphate acyltransferase PlsY